MPQYIFSDEDNEPMHFSLLEDADGHNPTVYKSYAEMIAEERLPFTDPPEHPDGCWNCFNYDGDYCTAGWNNLDPSYKNPDTDERKPNEWCEMHDSDDSIAWEEFFDE